MAEITLYGLKTCDTCRKALKELEASGHPARFVDVRADGVEAAQLSAWYAAVGPDLVNRRSTTWKGLGAEDRARAETAEGAVALLSENPTLMKRPVVDQAGSIHVGWTPELRHALMG